MVETPLVSREPLSSAPQMVLGWVLGGFCRAEPSTSYTCSTSGVIWAYMVHLKEKSGAVVSLSLPWSRLSAAPSPPSLSPPAAQSQQVPLHHPAF